MSSVDQLLELLREIFPHADTINLGVTTGNLDEYLEFARQSDVDLRREGFGRGRDAVAHSGDITLVVRHVGYMDYDDEDRVFARVEEAQHQRKTA